jgi:hypothetical protein
MASPGSQLLLRFCFPLGLAGFLSACNGDDHVSPEPRQMVALAGDHQAGEAGAQLPDPLVVRIVDAESRPVAGSAVVWEVDDGAGVVSPRFSTTGAD